MNLQQATEIFLVIMLAVVIAYDIFAQIRWGKDSTISWTVLQLSMKHPIIPLLTGIVIGHVFWSQP